MSTETFGEYIQTADPVLWGQVVKSGISEAAVFTWSAEQLSGLKFSGSHYTPCGSLHGPMLDVTPTGRYDWTTANTAAWQGLPRERVQLGYRCRKTIWWVRPDSGDPARLGILLTRARARWLAEPPPMPGELFNEAYGELLVEEAAEVGDLEAMRGAIEHYGVDYDPDAYSSALFLAARRGDIAFIQELVELAPHVCDGAFWACDSADFGDISPEHRAEVFTLLDAGIPLPTCCQSVVVRWICELGDKAPSHHRDEVLKLFLDGLPIPAGCRPAVVAWAAPDSRFLAALL